MFLNRKLCEVIASHTRFKLVSLKVLIKDNYSKFS